MAYALGLPLPQNWQDFESLCKDLWRLIWDDPLAQKHGRSGDPQAGVDICGRRGEKWEGVQCKQKEWHKRLGAAQIRREADKAGGFEPALARFILATTVPRDPKTQADVRAINDAGEYPFEMAVFAWDDVLEELQAFPQLIRKFYPEWSRQALCGVPSTRSVQFVGREAELEQLRQLVRRAGSVRIAASVEGLAGIGKTELALQLVHRLAAEAARDFSTSTWAFSSRSTRAGCSRPLRAGIRLRHRGMRSCSSTSAVTPLPSSWPGPGTSEKTIPMLLSADRISPWCSMSRAIWQGRASCSSWPWNPASRTSEKTDL